MIKWTVLNATHKNIPQICEVLQKSQLESFVPQFLSLSPILFTLFLGRELTGLNTDSVPIFLTDRKASLKAKPDDSRPPKLKGEMRVG